MKKILFGGLLLALIGLVFLKISKQKPEIQIEPDCEAKMVATNKIFEKFEGTPKPVNFSTLPEAKTFYTRITEAVKTGPNFAGHFTLVYFGCGTDCYGYAVVNVRTGEIISYSPANSNYHLRMNYGLDSNYFVLDPVEAGQERRSFQITEDENGKNKLELACTETAKEGLYSSN